MILLVPIIFTSFISKKENKTIFEFGENRDLSNWYILNDGVMGGVSSSSFNIDKNGFGNFEGHVSTDNNGGFASVRYRSNIYLNDSKSIKLRIKGDGKDYQFRIKQNSSDFESYITTFSTTGLWETIELEFKDMYPSFRGQKLDKPNFGGLKFDELSILIGNKRNESFSLKIDKIEL